MKRELNNISQDFNIGGRILPQEVEIENRVLSILLQYGDKAATVIFPILQYTDFYKPDNQTIYNAIVSLFADGVTIDLLTVESKTEMMNYLLELSTLDLGLSGHNAETWQDYAKIVKNASNLRQLISLFIKQTQNCFNILENSDSIAQETLLGVEAIRTTNEEKKSLKEVLIEEVTSDKKDGGFLGLRTGFKKFDKITLGLTAPDLIVVAAGPGEGKSTWTLNIAKEISKQDPVLIFSLEMKQRQLIQKILSDYFNMPVKDVRLGKYDTASPILDRISALKLHIYDNAGISIDDLVSIAKAEVMRHKIKLIVVDYLQLLAKGGTKMNKADEVGMITRKFKLLAMDTNVPVIALSQLSRDKQRKYYSLSDLRDSGAIEQDADGVVFIFRPSEHKMTTYDLGGKNIDCNEKTAIVSIAKWRMGDKGDFEMIFNGACSRFEDTREVMDPMPDFGNGIIGFRNDLEEIPF